MLTMVPPLTSVGPLQIGLEGDRVLKIERATQGSLPVEGEGLAGGVQSAHLTVTLAQLWMGLRALPRLG